METLTWNIETADPIVILALTGYFSGTSGKQLEAALQPHLERGLVKVLIDFSHCPLMNSPGVVSLMDLAIKISDEFGGQVAVCGLDALKQKVFQVAGVFEYVDAAPTIEAAKSLLVQ